MGMTHLKIVNASRGPIHKYEDLKRKLYKCNANIYFNQQCLKQHLTPSYARIKIPNTAPAHKYTQHKIPTIRIKDEIRYLHCKKQRLNLQIIPPTLTPSQHMEQGLATHTSYY